ncbi:unnamed protein product [Lactuca saligna]|uniref:Uncharacterized protein n=1 Tax=Lactuca saligna TaxID=75948 RepID=A0AA35V0Y2_LACSI|nr:unnamed protein product [Lactuca saligna]
MPSKNRKTKGDSSNPAPSFLKQKNEQEVNFVPFPPPSPASTSIPITIVPCPPPITTQSPPVTTAPPTSIPRQTPIFTETTTTTTTAKPPVSVNASDAGEKTSWFATTTTTSPISPQHHHGSEDFLGAKGLDFDTFHYSPFSIQEDSDDDAPLAQKDLKALNVKLDTLIVSSTASSSHAYSEEAIKTFLNTLVKEQTANLDKVNKAFENFTCFFLQATKKVDKLIYKMKTFMIEINTTVESNASKAYDAIVLLNASLHKERETLEKLRTDICTDNFEFQTSIS